MRLLALLSPAFFLRRARIVRLTSKERKHMTAAIRAHVRAVPLAEESYPVIFGGSFLHLPHLTALHALAPLCAAVLLVVGVASAAEEALPGDALYSMKLVNENVLDAVTFTTEGRTWQSTRRAVRRLDEAVILAAEERLDPERAESLRAAFVAEAAHVGERVRSLQRRGLDEAALEVLATFEASLRAHGVVLTDLVTEEAAFLPRTEELLLAIEEEAKELSTAQQDTAARIVTRGSPISGVVQSTRRATQAHLKQVRSTADGLLPRLSSNDASRIEAGVRSAEEGLQEAEARLLSGALLEALRVAGQSLRRAEEMELVLVGRSRAIPESNIRFVPLDRRELQRRTEIHEERLRLRHEREQQRSLEETLEPAAPVR